MTVILSILLSAGLLALAFPPWNVVPLAFARVAAAFFAAALRLVAAALRVAAPFFAAA